MSNTDTRHKGRVFGPPSPGVVALSLAFVASTVAICVPLWATDLLPFMDLPQHLATVRILHSLDDPAFGLAALHQIDLSRTQYLLYYFLVDGLAHGMSIETANRVVLSLYCGGLPLSLAYFMRAFGRDMAVGLLAAPIAFNTFLFMGLLNYVTGFPLLFLGLALLRRIMDYFSWGRFTAHCL